jgi:hypothetical protein
MPDTARDVIPSVARDLSCCLKGPSLGVCSGRALLPECRVREAGVGARVLAMGEREKRWMEKRCAPASALQDFSKTGSNRLN